MAGIRFAGVISLLAGLVVLAGPSPKTPTPLPRAHAHNDYKHQRPLLDALDHGFCNVEADVHLVKTSLLVAHDRHELSPERSLNELYLKPLRKLAKSRKGQIFREPAAFTLLIDLKSDPKETYPRLREILSRNADVLTTFHSHGLDTNAITVILTGNRPPTDLLAEEEPRYAALDGRIEDLDSNAPVSLIPLISDNWTKHFQWNGIGPMPEAEQKKLREFVKKAHQHGRRLRFWATPDQPTVWKELSEAGVDLIGTDNLEELELFLRNRPG